MTEDNTPAPVDEKPAPLGTLAVVKAGWNAYSTVKDSVTAVASPVRFVKDKALEFLVRALLSALKTTVGPKLAQLALDRLNLVGRTLPLCVPIKVPASVAKRLDADMLVIAQNVANEALAGPLELLGYRLGRLSVLFDSGTRVLTVDFEAGLLPSTEPAPQLAAPSPKVEEHDNGFARERSSPEIHDRPPELNAG